MAPLNEVMKLNPYQKHQWVSKQNSTLKRVGLKSSNRTRVVKVKNLKNINKTSFQNGLELSSIIDEGQMPPSWIKNDLYWIVEDMNKQEEL